MRTGFMVGLTVSGIIALVTAYVLTHVLQPFPLPVSLFMGAVAGGQFFLGPSSLRRRWLFPL